MQVREKIREQETQEILTVAQEYREKGYEVLIRPDAADLPDFLKDFRIDLLARNARENVIIEVKSRRDLTASRHLILLTEAIQNQPGWSVDLVVTAAGQQTISNGNRSSFDQE